jgi:hypothetical protein
MFGVVHALRRREREGGNDDARIASKIWPQNRREEDAPAGDLCHFADYLKILNNVGAATQ